MSHVFVSYKREDRDFAENLMGRLKGAGLPVWIDGDRLKAGEDWGAEIDRAIRDAVALIVVLTPEARASEYVTYEWSFALGAGVRVIPVLLRPTEPHPRLRTLHCLDFTGLNARPWGELIQEVGRAVADLDLISASLAREAPPHLQRAITALDSADPAERSGAIDVLAGSDQEAGRAALVVALRHPNRDVRVRASIALAPLQDLRALAGLSEGLRDPEFRPRAAQALGFLGASALPVLLDSLRDPEEAIRKTASSILSRLGPPAVRELIAILREEEHPGRREAAEGLTACANAACVPDLLGLIPAEQDPEARRSLVSILAGLGGQESLPMLIASLSDTDPSIRGIAACGLGRIGDTSAIGPLIARLTDPASVRSMPRDLVPDRLVHVDRYEYLSVRNLAATALTRIGSPEALRAVKEHQGGARGFRLFGRGK